MDRLFGVGIQSDLQYAVSVFNSIYLFGRVILDFELASVSNNRASSQLLLGDEGSRKTSSPSIMALYFSLGVMKTFQ